MSIGYRHDIFSISRFAKSRSMFLKVTVRTFVVCDFGLQWRMARAWRDTCSDCSGGKVGTMITLGFQCITFTVTWASSGLILDFVPSPWETALLFQRRLSLAGLILGLHPASLESALPMMSQITRKSSVCSTVYTGQHKKKTPTVRITLSLCDGNSPLTDGFP